MAVSLLTQTIPAMAENKETITEKIEQKIWWNELGFSFSFALAGLCAAGGVFCLTSIKDINKPPYLFENLAPAAAVATYLFFSSASLTSSAFYYLQKAYDLSHLQNDALLEETAQVK